MSETLLEAHNLKKYFPITGGIFGRKIGADKAVDGVSLTLQEGEMLGLVVESGSGKSTTGRMLLRMIEPTEGYVTFAGRNINKLSNREMRLIRKDMQMVFQDPYASLNPRHTVGKIIEEPLKVHGTTAAKKRRRKMHAVAERASESSEHKV